MSTPPPRDKKGARTGFTTGACAAAAARAATRAAILQVASSDVEITLPNRSKVTFALHRCEIGERLAECSIIKDGGDDPDCTHGAEIVATVELVDTSGIEIVGGVGVARVTKPGLGLEVGSWAINPVPTRNIREMVTAELVSHECGQTGGVRVTISVPEGERLALQTTNARLGLLGGISILGTTGIVRPYSTAAFKASVVQEIDVAIANGQNTIVMTTGGKSEEYAMKLHPELDAQAFVQVGDFIGVGLKHAARRSISRAIVVGMIGKLSKMAKGKMQTHVAGSQVDMEFLAELATDLGAGEPLIEEIRKANTARHVLELCKEAGLGTLPEELCNRAKQHFVAYMNAAHVAVEVLLVDFGGALLGRTATQLEMMRSEKGVTHE